MHSIQGDIRAVTEGDREVIYAEINKHPLRKLDPHQADQGMSFEVWVATTEAATQLWLDLQVHVDRLGGSLQRHECYHDDPAVNRPCVILERYPPEG